MILTALASRNRLESTTKKSGPYCCAQSFGGVLMPQTFSGLTNAKPKSHNFSCSPREMQFTMRAYALFPDGRPSTLTVLPTCIGWSERRAHPWTLTRIITAREDAFVESRPVRVTGISQGIRVLLRTEDAGFEAITLFTS